YSALASRKTVVDALDDAKLVAMRAGAPPSVWAAFELVGDPATLVPLTPRPSRTVWWVAMGGVAAAAIVGLGWRSRPGRSTRRSPRGSAVLRPRVSEEQLTPASGRRPVGRVPGEQRGDGWSEREGGRQMPEASTDPAIRGKTIRFTWTDGPTKGTT